MARKFTGEHIVAPYYTIHPRQVIETQYKASWNQKSETIFSLGNGYIGMRGTFEEELGGADLPEAEKPPTVEGTYLNGFYETAEINYPEIAFGYAKLSQTMLNLANAKRLQITLNGETYRLLDGKILDFERVLHIDSGILERRMHWRSPNGQEIEIETLRLVSLANRYLAAIRFTLTPLNFGGEVRLVSVLDGDVRNQTAGNDPRIGSDLRGRALMIKEYITEGEFAALYQQTYSSGMGVVAAVQNRLQTDCAYTTASGATPTGIEVTYTVAAAPGTPITLEKMIAYVSTQDTAPGELITRARSVVETAHREGLEAQIAEQRSVLDQFWAHADVTIDGDDALQQGIRYNMLQLFQSAGRGGMTSIAAKGLTGEGYGGHYFWDTEMYVVPFFLFTDPRISRDLLEYRFNILDRARARAREMAHETGALYSWRTINGDECSAYYPAGTAQYHINADIAFAIKRYVEATGDTDFLYHFGAEILFETARLWADLGDYIPRKGGQFCINEVTGPDEYTACVDNNCYTNLMAQVNLRYAAQVAAHMHAVAPEQYAELASRIGLSDAEISAWQRAADAMYIPYDAETGLYMQDDSFLDKTPWDFENTPDDHYPLLLHYHPLVIYRHQVCKQADLVLALQLLPERFTLEEKKRNYDFYERVTTHDSSLSTGVFSIVASDIGDYDLAYRYFMSTARMDLDDYHGNVKDGVHIANMANTWIGIVNGFGGVRLGDQGLRTKPHLPERWRGYQFRLCYRDRLIEVTVGSETVKYALVSGAPLEATAAGVSLGSLAVETPILTRPDIEVHLRPV